MVGAGLRGVVIAGWFAGTFACMYTPAMICVECGVCRNASDCPSDTQDCVQGVCREVANASCTSDAACQAPQRCEELAGADCVAGECRYVPAARDTQCDDDQPCTDRDACDGAAHCRGVAQGDGTPCQDNSGQGTRSGTCQQGKCVQCLQPSDCPNNAPYPGCVDVDCIAGWCQTTVQPSRPCAAQSCSVDTLLFARSCGPLANCPNSGTASCGGYRCAGSTGCGSGPCNGDSDCAAGFYCDANTACAPCETNESDCTDTLDNDCDGSPDCADASCAVACGTCTSSEPTGETTCDDGQDNDCDGAPDCADPACDAQLCAANHVCSAGACRGGLGDPCQGPSDCSSGFCVDNVCCESACTTECFGCDVPGSPGSCVPRQVGDATGCPTCQACDDNQVCVAATGPSGNNCTGSDEMCCSGVCMLAPGGSMPSCGVEPCAGTWTCGGSSPVCSSFGQSCSYCSYDSVNTGTCEGTADSPYCLNAFLSECPTCRLCAQDGNNAACTGYVQYGDPDYGGVNGCGATDVCDGTGGCTPDPCSIVGCPSQCCLRGNCCVTTYACFTNGTCADCNESACTACCGAPCTLSCGISQN